MVFLDACAVIYGVRHGSPGERHKTGSKIKSGVVIPAVYRMTKFTKETAEKSFQSDSNQHDEMGYLFDSPKPFPLRKGFF